MVQEVVGQGGDSAAVPQPLRVHIDAKEVQSQAGQTRAAEEDVLRQIHLLPADRTECFWALGSLQQGSKKGVFCRRPNSAVEFWRQCFCRQ